MNLVVAARHEPRLMRFRVEGRWDAGDALKLAYLIKASLARARQDHILVDLSNVRASPGARGKFLICDRLRRALSPNARIGLVGAQELVDGPGILMPASQCPDIALFNAESDALDWLSDHTGQPQ